MSKQENNKLIFEQRIKDMFSKQAPNDTDLIWQIVSLIIYENSVNTDLADLYEIMSHEDFLRVINLYGGRTVQFPSVDEIQKTLLMSILFYYKEIKGLSWEEIKKLIPFEFTASDSISYGIKIRNLNTWIRQKIQELFKENEDHGTN